MAQAQRLTRVGSRVIKVPDTPEYWSPVSFEIFGINPDDGPPKNIAEFLLHVHPADREAVGRARAEIFPKGLVFDYKYRIVRPNGDARLIRDVGSPVSEGGVVKRYVGAWMENHRLRATD